MTAARRFSAMLALAPVIGATACGTEPADTRGVSEATAVSAPALSLAVVEQEPKSSTSYVPTSVGAAPDSAAIQAPVVSEPTAAVASWKGDYSITGTLIVGDKFAMICPVTAESVFPSCDPNLSLLFPLDPATMAVLDAVAVPESDPRFAELESRVPGQNWFLDSVHATFQNAEVSTADAFGDTPYTVSPTLSSAFFDAASESSPQVMLAGDVQQGTGSITSLDYESESGLQRIAKALDDLLSAAGPLSVLPTGTGYVVQSIMPLSDRARDAVLHVFSGSVEFVSYAVPE
jgi:hypothetical protein